MPAQQQLEHRQRKNEKRTALADQFNSILIFGFVQPVEQLFQHLTVAYIVAPDALIIRIRKTDNQARGLSCGTFEKSSRRSHTGKPRLVSSSGRSARQRKPRHPPPGGGLLPPPARAPLRFSRGAGALLTPRSSSEAPAPPPTWRGPAIVSPSRSSNSPSMPKAAGARASFTIWRPRSRTSERPPKSCPESSCAPSSALTLEWRTSEREIARGVTLHNLGLALRRLCELAPDRSPELLERSGVALRGGGNTPGTTWRKGKRFLSSTLRSLRSGGGRR